MSCVTHGRLAASPMGTPSLLRSTLVLEPVARSRTAGYFVVPDKIVVTIRRDPGEEPQQHSSLGWVDGLCQQLC